jgi:exodeoxyribonuclease III
LVRVATFNVNSIAVRLPILLAWLDQAKPDIVCLQEIKCPAADFPLLELRSLGYHVEAVGQRSYNGVAILSREPARDVLRALPGDPADDQARYIEATVGDLRVASLYLPNGNPIGTEKFTYKLAWMRRLKVHAAQLLAREIPFVLAGDYNVAPNDDDVYDPGAVVDDAICQPESRARFRALLNLGLVDAFRVFHDEPHRFSFWDYQAGRWYRDEGLRIDHLLLSPQAADRLAAADIDKSPRGKDKASDHTPVWCAIT